MKKKFPTFRFEKPLWKKGYYVIGVDEVGRGALAGPLTVGAVCFYFDKALQPASRINNTSKNSATQFLSHESLTSPSAGPLESEKIAFASFLAKTLLPPEKIKKLGINDSKKLTAKRREELAKIIKKISLGYSTSSVQPGVISRLGIVKATEKAIRKAVTQVIKKLSNLEIKNKLYFNCLITQLPNYYLLIDAFYVKYLRGIGLKKQKAIIKGDEKSISIAAAAIIAKVERDHTMIKLGHKYPIYFWEKNKGYGTRRHIEAIKKFGKSKLHRDLYLRKLLEVEDI